MARSALMKFIKAIQHMILEAVILEYEARVVSVGDIRSITYFVTVDEQRIPERVENYALVIDDNWAV